MRFCAYLVIVLAVAIGSLAASTAYLAPLDAPDEMLVGAVLNGPAGVQMTAGGKREPLFIGGQELTLEVLQELRQNEAVVDDRAVRPRYVRVKDFSFARWPGRWWFLASLAVTGGATMWLRRRPAGTDDSVDAAAETSSAMSVLESIERHLAALAGRLDAGGDRLAMVIESTTNLQKNEIAAFVDGQSTLVDRLGLGVAAEVMAAFAAAERQVNRAWSAASDGALEEAVDCVDAARRQIEATRAVLADITSAKLGQAARPQ